jgi:hypothetical protein
VGKIGKAIKNENERFGRFGFSVKTCNFHVTWMLQTWSICVIFHLLNDGWMWLDVVENGVANGVENPHG